MAIVHQETFSFRGSPLRLYLHNTNLESTFSSVENAINHGLATIGHNAGIILPAQWIISFLYGWPDKKAHPQYASGFKQPQLAKMVDVFGFYGLPKTEGSAWKSNPTIKSWVFKNGVYAPSQDVGCGIEAIVLGREEEARLTTKDISEYYMTIPDLPTVALK